MGRTSLLRDIIGVAACIATVDSQGYNTRVESSPNLFTIKYLSHVENSYISVDLLPFCRPWSIDDMENLLYTTYHPTKPALAIRPNDL